MIQYIYTTFAVAAHDTISACEDINSWAEQQSKSFENIIFKGQFIEKVNRVAQVQAPVIQRNNNNCGVNINVQLECVVRFLERGMVVPAVTVDDSKGKLKCSRGDWVIVISQNDYELNQGDKIFVVTEKVITKSLSRQVLFGADLFLPWRQQVSFFCQSEDITSSLELINNQLDKMNAITASVIKNEQVQQWVQALKLLQTKPLIASGLQQSSLIAIEQIVKDPSLVRNKKISIVDSYCPLIVLTEAKQHEECVHSPLTIILLSAIERQLMLLNMFDIIAKDNIKISKNYDQYLSVIDMLSQIEPQQEDDA